MRLSNTGRTHEQQTAIDRRIFTRELVRMKQRIILRSAGFAFEIVE